MHHAEGRADLLVCVCVPCLQGSKACAAIGSRENSYDTESGPNPEDDPPSVDRHAAGLDSVWMLYLSREDGLSQSEVCPSGFLISLDPSTRFADGP